jgi:hypothetical protein
MCKVGALTFEELDEALKRKTDEIGHSVIQGGEPPAGDSFTLLKAVKKAQCELTRR